MYPIGRVHMRENGEEHVPDTRLPGNTIPSTYDIDLVILNDGPVANYGFSGRVKITADVDKQNSDNDGKFIINVDDIISVNDSSLSLNVDGAGVNIQSILYDFERQFFVINYPVQQPQSFRIQAEMEFYGDIEIGWIGRGYY